MLSVIVCYPGCVALACVALLPVSVWLLRRVEMVGAIIVLAPFTPLLVVRGVAYGIMALCDLAVAGRWAEPLRYAAQQFEESL